MTCRTRLVSLASRSRSARFAAFPAASVDPRDRRIRSDSGARDRSEKQDRKSEIEPFMGIMPTTENYFSSQEQFYHHSTCYPRQLGSDLQSRTLLCFVHKWRCLQPRFPSQWLPSRRPRPSVLSWKEVRFAPGSRRGRDPGPGRGRGRRPMGRALRPDWPHGCADRHSPLPASPSPESKSFLRMHMFIFVQCYSRTRLPRKPIYPIWTTFSPAATSPRSTRAQSPFPRQSKVAV